jgi:hypothetical protein
VVCASTSLKQTSASRCLTEHRGPIVQGSTRCVALTLWLEARNALDTGLHHPSSCHTTDQCYLGTSWNKVEYTHYSFLFDREKYTGRMSSGHTGGEDDV